MKGCEQMFEDGCESETIESKKYLLWEKQYLVNFNYFAFEIIIDANNN